MTTFFIRRKNENYYPTISTDNKEEVEKIFEQYRAAGYSPVQHIVYEDNREEYFLISYN